MTTRVHFVVNVNSTRKNIGFDHLGRRPTKKSFFRSFRKTPHVCDPFIVAVVVGCFAVLVDFSSNLLLCFVGFFVSFLLLRNRKSVPVMESPSLKSTTMITERCSFSFVPHYFRRWKANRPERRTTYNNHRSSRKFLDSPPPLKSSPFQCDRLPTINSKRVSCRLLWSFRIHLWFGFSVQSDSLKRGDFIRVPYATTRWKNSFHRSPSFLWMNPQNKEKWFF